MLRTNVKGLSKKMEFVKAAICYLVTRTLESD